MDEQWTSMPVQATGADAAASPGTLRSREPVKEGLTSQRAPVPGRLLLVVAAAVFIGEAAVMLLLPALGLARLWQEVLIDALTITLITLPTLDYFVMRPLRQQIAARERTDIALRAEITERALAEERLERSNAELRALGQIEHSQRRFAEALTEAAVALNSSLDLDEVLDRTLEQVHRVVPCRALAVLLLKDEWVRVARYRDRLGLWHALDGFPVDRFNGLPLIAAAQTPYVNGDTRQDLAWSAPPDLEWVRSVAMMPLVSRGRTLGFLVTFSELPSFFRDDIVRFLESFAAYAAVALQRADIYNAELQARQTVESLSAASQALTQTLDLVAVLDLLLVSLHRLVPYEWGCVALLESESELVVHAIARGGVVDRGAEGEARPRLVLELADQPAMQRVLQSGEAAVANRVGGLPCCTPARAQATPDAAPDPATAAPISWLGVPIVAGGRTLGLCSLEREDAQPFSDEQARLVEAIAGQAAVAVQNAWLFEQVRAGRGRLQALSHRLVQVQESERLYIARELHDEAGQALASLTLGLGDIERNAGDPARVAADVQQLRQVVNDVQENLHRLAMDLRPASLDQLGLAAALEALVDKLQRQFMVVAQFKAVGWSDERLNTEVEVALYRIGQEALTNVVRHARATHVDILLQRREGAIVLTVEDDGVGFDADAPKPEEHMGLASMRERCEMLGGTLAVESSPGAGTTIVAEIPDAPANSDL